MKTEEEFYSEIRRIKMELLKEQLDDKMFGLKSFLERKNSSLNSTQTNNSTDSTKEAIETDGSFDFGSILFVKVFGVFEVWHLVLFFFLAWIFVLMILNRLRKQNALKRAKSESRTNKHKNKMKPIFPMNVSFSDTCALKEIDYASHNQSIVSDTSTTKCSNASDIEFVNLDVSRLITPTKRDRLLYTVREQQMIKDKTFTFKNRPSTQLKAFNLQLSKSDTNISI